MRSTHTHARPVGLRTWATWAAGLAVLLAAPLSEGPALAQEAFTLQLEPAAAFWLDSPQSDRFTPGFYLAVRPGVALGRVVSLQLSYALLYTPAADGYTEDGSAHFLMAGVRLRPFGVMQSDDSHYGGGLWLDFNLGYARTDKLDRFAFDFGLGYGFQVTPAFALGPVVRYGQIVQANDTPNVDPNDAQFLTVGLNFTFGESYEPAEERVVYRDAPEGPVYAEPKAVVCARAGCPDRDHDGVCDDFDKCPDDAGPVAALGCPVDPCTGKPLVVLVQFPYNSAALPATSDRAEYMDPMLDAVAAAIARDPTCNVCVIGYASQEGPAAHNLELSRERAKAVQGYLTARGIAALRVPTTGMGDTCLLVPEESDVLNRRVEFRRLAPGETCPATCSESR